MSLKSRIEWIDTAKGIGIILVVLAHIWLAKEGYHYINSFHVPLFFFLSGYLMNFEKYDGVMKFITGKFNNIVVPYFWFSLLTYLYWLLIERRFSGNAVSPADAFINILIAPGSDQYLPHNPAIWFLPCLFMVTIIFYLIARNQKLVNIVIGLLVSLAIGYVTPVYLSTALPWSIDVVPIAIVFYGMGFIMKKNPIVDIKSNYIRLLLFCCCISGGFFISQLNGEVLMVDNSYGDYFYFYIAAFLGIISVVIIAMYFEKNKVLLYLGKNSIIIFALHFPVKRVVTACTGKVLNIPLEQIKNSFLISCVDTIITIVILLPLIYLIHTQFYFILGGKYGNNRLTQEVIKDEKPLQNEY